MEVEVNMKPRIDIKNGIYKAKLDRIESKDVPTKDPKKPTAEYSVFIFKLDDPKLPVEAKGYELEMSMPGRVTPNSKLSAFLTKAGIQFMGKKSLELDVLIGRNAEVMVGKRTFAGKDGKNIDTPEIKDVEFQTSR
jgi:hypothetical protein